jgi:hypothetical protein
MAVMKSSSRAGAALGFVVALQTGLALAQASLPSLNAPDLAQGPYSHMQMLLEKFYVDVATVEVRVDKPTQTRFAELAKGQSYSAKLEQDLAAYAFGAQRAVVQTSFKMSISFSNWIGVLRDNLKQARKAGLITADIEKRIGQDLPQRLAGLKDRGYEKDDRFIYSVTPHAVQVAVFSKSGQVLANFTEKDMGARRAVMACFFAPNSDYRKPLLRSLMGAKR